MDYEQFVINEPWDNSNNFSRSLQTEFQSEFELLYSALNCKWSMNVQEDDKGFRKNKYS